MKKYETHTLELRYYVLIEKLKSYGAVRSNRMIIRRVFVWIFRARLRKRLKRLYKSYLGGHISIEMFSDLELTINTVL